MDRSARVLSTLPFPEEVGHCVVQFLDVWDRAALSGTSQILRAALKHETRVGRNALLLFRSDPAQSLQRLCSLGLVRPTPDGLAAFLFGAHGKLPAACVGRFLSQPPEVERETQRQLAADVTRAYLARLDFADDSPVQALRRLLARTRMPAGSKTCVE